MDLADFLLARFAEDEQAALRAGNLRAWKVEFGEPYLENETTGERIPLRVHAVAEGVWLNHAVRHLPARVLAECDAKRRIVEEMSHDGFGRSVWTLKMLTLPYADHPDYREEWRP